ncbi:MAG: alpha/beta fold hydrolase [Planctomycetaceae bacterium]|nr:alpha/beta fold hydrolase [Planctomycetaceae bacterium]
MSNAELLPCVEIEPEVPARACVIWLHGLGADGHDFEPIVPELRLPRELGVRFLLPHAPSIPVTLNGGMRMPAWYDIRDLDLRTRHDPVGIARSREQVEALIAREVARGIPARRIALVGFSQGGAIALHTALRHPERLACAIGLSTYLVLPETLGPEASEANRDLPILMVHGVHDPMVTYERGAASRDKLVELGYAVDFKSYPMMHEVCLEEVRDVARALATTLK